MTDLTDITGRVLERYYYDPYGSPEVVVDAHPFDWDDDGDVDETDTDACKSGGDCYGDYSGDCRRLDADADRDIDDDDFDIVSAYADSLPASTALQRVPAATRSVLGNTFFHQGLVLDPELGSFQNRMRQYAAKQHRFMQRDPLGEKPLARVRYQDGMNLYTRGRMHSYVSVDPTGECVSEAAACEELRRLTPQSPIKPAGLTGCCGGAVITCNYYSEEDDPWGGLRACVDEHENHHKSSCLCPPVDENACIEVSLCRTRRGLQEVSECEAHDIEVECVLREKEQRCAGPIPDPEGCSAAMDGRIRYLCQRGTEWCNKAAMSGMAHCPQWAQD